VLKLPDAARFARQASGPAHTDPQEDNVTDPIRLEAGDQFPDFSLLDQAGNSVSPADFRGEKLVIFTFPQAFTPGCTTEACDFRDSEARLTSADYRVLSISADSVDKLADFKTKYELPYTLLSDPGHEVQRQLAAYGEKNNYGKVVQGAIRSTFLVDESGKVIDALYNVKATGHVDRVLKKLADS
jgi:peroxiredoxin Q/BCP